MVLTRPKTSASLRRDLNKFPAAQLALLALVRVAEPIALTSIFPYAWQLVLDFHVGDRANASFYAGLLISAFALAESLTGIYWGGLSDKLGRKPVLIMGCFGTIASLLIVGFSFNFWIALFGRFLGGALNGNIGVIQTMVAELVTDPKHEPKAYAVMPFVWSVGIIIGPAVGGYFATPAKNFPDTVLDNRLFRSCPYLLPNLICTGLMVVSIAAGWILLEETHPLMEPEYNDAAHTPDESSTITSVMAIQGTTTMPAVNLTQNKSYGTFNDVSEEAAEEEWLLRADGTTRTPSIRSLQAEKWLTRRVAMLMVALGIFTYHSMTYDHLMPIFFQDQRVPIGGEVIEALASTIGTQYGSFAGGLGLTIQQCGIILAFNGIIALVVQGLLFPLLASFFGVWRSFMIVTVLHPIAYFIVPWLALLPDYLLYPGIYACLTIRNLLSIVAYPVLLILIKEASQSNTSLGKINGLAASTGAACRTMASPIAGLLYGIGDKIDFTALAWWASAAVAIVGAIQAFTVRQETGGRQHQIRPKASCRFIPDAEEARWRRKSSVVRIRVGGDSGYGSEDGNGEGEQGVGFASRVRG